jgi:methylated-DNA-[protein]-cysteine S-methyltransferase
MLLEHAYCDSPLGRLKVSADTIGIVGVRFIDDTPETQPVATSNSMITDCIAQLNAYFSGKQQTFSLTLAAKGTEFQQKVWTNLRTVPYGSTASYLHIAKAVGNAKAVRAVGSANGKNPLAIIVPCHRIIGSNQKLTGYAGGLWRKQWLLHFEQQQLGLINPLF